MSFGGKRFRSSQVPHTIHKRCRWRPRDAIRTESVNQTLDSRQALNSIAQMKERSTKNNEINYYNVHNYVLIYLILGAINTAGAILARRFRKLRAVGPTPASKEATGSSPRFEQVILVTMSSISKMMVYSTNK
jgi:hypothetical protein